MPQQSKVKRQQYHDPPGEKVFGDSSELVFGATKLAPLPQFDAPAPKRYDPSVLVPADSGSILSSNLASSSASSLLRNRHGGASAMSNNPYLTNTKSKALPRMKKSTENSESSMIGSFNRGEEMEPSFIRVLDSSDSKSLLRPGPPTVGGINDSVSVLKLVAPDDSEDYYESVLSSAMPPQNEDFVERLLPIIEKSKRAPVMQKLDPSITGGFIASHRSDPTLIRPDLNQHPIAIEQDRLNPSIASLTKAGITKKLDPSIEGGFIMSHLSDPTLIRPDLNQHPVATEQDHLYPFNASLTIAGNSKKLDPSSIGGFIASHPSDPTLIRPDRNQPPIAAEQDHLDASIASLPIAGNTKKLDPSISGGFIASHRSDPTLIRPDLNKRPISAEQDHLDPSLASLTIAGSTDASLTKLSSSSVREESPSMPNVGVTRGNLDPSVASSTSIVTSETIVPSFMVEPLPKEVNSTIENETLNPSVYYDVSTASDSTMATATFLSFSKSEALLPTLQKYTSSGRDPSIATYEPTTQSVSMFGGDEYEYGDDDVFHPKANVDETTESSYSVSDDIVANDSPNPSNNPNSHNYSVNLARRSTTSTSSNSSSGLNASNYFERSLIEEFNHCIEAEQRDSSVMAIPMVPALLDDATTLVAPPINTAASVAQSQQPGAFIHNGTSTSSNHHSSGTRSSRSTSTHGTNATQAPVISLQSQPPSSPRQSQLSSPRQSRSSALRQSHRLLPRQLSMKQLTKLRQEHGLPVGVVMEMARYQKFAYTYFVCDTNNIEEDCIQECAKLATEAQSEVIFCLGNKTDAKEILYPPPSSPSMTDIQQQRSRTVALQACVSTIRSSTWSTTPVMRTTHKLIELAQRIPKLEYWKTEKVSVVIATNRTFGVDGQEEYAHFIHGIQSLLRIRVQIVIRLSTLDDNLVQYFNRIKVMFPTVGVLSTYERQNQLVQKYNPWFNYGEPLHRLRELGYQFHHTIALLSECKLNRDELRVFFVEFYGKKAMMFSPDIRSEWDEFYRFVDSINNREGKHRLGLNLKNKQHRDYWMNIRKLDSFYTSRRNLLLPRRRSSTRSSKMDQQCLRIEL